MRKTARNSSDEAVFSPQKPSRYVYGPVLSRRLGLSLGIDILPPKTCNLDCIYCQLGPTKKRASCRHPFFRSKDILAAIKAALLNSQQPDYLTFSGSGEPTLNAHLGGLIAAIKKFTPIPVAVLTNSTLLPEKEVRQELSRADLLIPSLDTASPEVFRLINRPDPSISIENIIEGLIHLREEYAGQIWLEIMLVKGVNDEPTHLQKLKEAISRIRPDRVQLNTVVRPPAEPWVLSLTKEELEGAREILGNTVEIVTATTKRADPRKEANLQSSILGILWRRPSSCEQLAAALGKTPEEVRLGISTLLKRGAIQIREYQGLLQYEVRKERRKGEPPG